MLLERERELAAVDELLERGGVVLIEGGAGIGKTRCSDRRHPTNRASHQSRLHHLFSGPDGDLWPGRR
jgi:hypothetical protein